MRRSDASNSPFKLQKMGYTSWGIGWRQRLSASSLHFEIGYADAFEDIYDDPIAHFEAEVERRNAEARAAEAATIVKFSPGGNGQSEPPLTGMQHGLRWRRALKP